MVRNYQPDFKDIQVEEEKPPTIWPVMVLVGIVVILIVVAFIVFFAQISWSIRKL